MIITLHAGLMTLNIAHFLHLTKRVRVAIISQIKQRVLGRLKMFVIILQRRKDINATQKKARGMNLVIESGRCQSLMITDQVYCHGSWNASRVP